MIDKNESKWKYFTFTSNLSLYLTFWSNEFICNFVIKAFSLSVKEDSLNINS
jgi:hypothetical protein